MPDNHIALDALPYTGPVRAWLADRYDATQADAIWAEVMRSYDAYLTDLPDLGGRKNGHAKAIYGGLLVFALYPALPDRPPIEELQDFVQSLFMEPFTTLGKVVNLNRSFDIRLIDRVFRASGNRDRRDATAWPAGFINVDGGFDKTQRATSYRFTQCPNAEFAKTHGLLHVLPLLCNSDFFGISELHGRLIRCGTCGNSDRCDYLVVGDKNPLTAEYETVTDEGGFLVSRKRSERDASATEEET